MLRDGRSRCRAVRHTPRQRVRPDVRLASILAVLLLLFSSDPAPQPAWQPRRPRHPAPRAPRPYVRPRRPPRCHVHLPKEREQEHRRRLDHRLGRGHGATATRNADNASRPHGDDDGDGNLLVQLWSTASEQGHDADDRGTSRHADVPWRCPNTTASLIRPSPRCPSASVPVAQLRPPGRRGGAAVTA